MIAITSAGFRTCFKLNKSSKELLAGELFPKVL